MKRDCVCPRARHQHGTLAAYSSDRCRCFPCRVTHAEAARTYRNGGSFPEMMVDATGTVRRLQALMRIGISQQVIGEHLGVTRDAVSKLMGRTRVISSTAERVADAYDTLWDQPGTGRVANYVRIAAERRGYLPPLAWDEDAIDLQEVDAVVHVRHDDATPGFIDEIAVERAMHGDTKCATRAEVSEAIRILTSNGYSADQIAARLGVSDRLVQRYRAKGRAA